jgi:DNA-binding CsgD family transcriptional regulator
MPDPASGAILPRYRLGKPGDVPEIMRHFARSAPLYGPFLETGALAQILTTLLEERAVLANLLVERNDSDGRGEPPQVLAVGITAFLEPSYTDAWLRSPPNAISDTLFDLERQQQRVLLRPSAVARHNASDGLDLVFLLYSPPLGDPSDPAVSRMIALTHDAFRVFHAGYHCRRLLHPAAPDEVGNETLATMGFRKLETGSGLFFFDLAALAQLPFHPFIILRRGTPPKLGFSPAEQDTLLHSLLGHTDQELATELGVSFETIRKRWKTIFSRVASNRSVSIFPPGSTEPLDGGRGPAKRRLVLEYVATHLEELRPYSSSSS